MASSRCGNFHARALCLNLATRTDHPASAPPQPLYYVFHRFLHNPQVYKASHQHHHTSIITEAISGTSHPLLESVGYLANFSFPFLVPAWCGCFSFPLVYLYFTFFDVLNCIGHCNFELVPRWAQKGPLKWLLYTGAYHSLHHSKFKFNFCLLYTSPSPRDS